MKGLLVLIGLLLHSKIDCESSDEFKPDDPLSTFEFGAVTESGVQNSTDEERLGLQDILIVSRTQANSLHLKKAKQFYNHLQKQILPEDKNKLVIKMLHENWAPFGAWTIFPILESLFEEYGKSKRWIFFCEEDTVIDLSRLIDVLQRFNSKESLFLGHAIQDEYPAIIHHFSFANDLSQFSFPDFSAGWALSIPLLDKLVKKMKSEKPLPEFTIDIQHEVALFIRNEAELNLTDVPEFCTTKPGDNKLCVTSFNNTVFDCGNLTLDDIFFAVKTTKKFHETRVPYVQKTLGLHAKHLVYYSETEDSSIPTENIDIPNTDTGHCAKLQAIIERSATDERFSTKPWVVVVDDDTIMSALRLRRLLSCYDPNEPILFGERYGYGVPTGYGYEYVTGGGGMVMSRAAVTALIDSEHSCWEPNSPDDMWLGSFFRRLNVPVTHSPAFHQARPMEYVPSLLAHQTPVSFHKHYEHDPLQVYRDYLS